MIYCKKPYNIITMDGGAIRGIITTRAIHEIEKAAYEYAEE